MILSKFAKWMCDCFCGGPVPSEDLVLTCDNSISGINPLIGEPCTEPELLDETPIPPTDPPRCHGNEDTPCPEASLWRAQFPCPVPGSGAKVQTMTNRTDVDLPADIPFADCPKCWVVNVPFMGGETGNVEAGCCADLVGDFELCYVPCEPWNRTMVWRTECQSIVRTGCGPRPGQAFKSKWRLTYDKVLTRWEARSYHDVGYPVYSLIDATPCDGEPKILTKESPAGESGCTSCPETLTFTSGEDCACPESDEEGYSVNLWRHCGQTKYQHRAFGALSAIVSENDADSWGSTLPADDGCCRSGYSYNAYDGCCYQQKQDYFGRTDPWKIITDRLAVVWELDHVAVPATLTGTFTQGEVTYLADTDLRCDAATHFRLTGSTLPAEIRIPKTCCVVPDKLMTCDVVYVDGATAQQNAGHESHESFCASNDSCSPSIPGSITVTDADGNACGGGAVCFSRSAMAVPRDADAKTRFGRIGCIRVWDGEKWNVRVIVVYPAGTLANPKRWAADHYCAEGMIGVNPRQCDSCEAYLGEFLGTTYADKEQCGAYPFFEAPPNAGACVCEGDPQEPVCCPGAPSSLFATLTSACSKLNGIVELLNIGDNEWQGFLGALDPCEAAGGFYVTASCVGGAWTIDILGNNCTGGTSTTTFAECDPVDVTFEDFTMSCASVDCSGTPTTDECDGATVSVTLGE